MVDVDKIVVFWRQSALEDWSVALTLLDSGNTRHSLFIAHLALEKLIKALYCRRKRELAPRIHNLVRLAELAGVQASREVIDVMADMNVFQIEGRYPDHLAPTPSGEEARQVMRRAQEAYEWLLNQF